MIQELCKCIIEKTTVKSQQILNIFLAGMIECFRLGFGAPPYSSELIKVRPRAVLAGWPNESYTETARGRGSGHSFSFPSCVWGQLLFAPPMKAGDRPYAFDWSYPRPVLENYLAPLDYHGGPAQRQRRSRRQHPHVEEHGCEVHRTKPLPVGRRGEPSPRICERAKSRFPGFMPRTPK